MMSLRPFVSRSAAALLLAGTVASGAAAAEPKLLGTFKDWNAFVYDENGKKVCYMASSPKKAEGNYSQRGDIYALVTHRPSEKSLDVVSIVTGYTYKPNSDVTVQIGNQSFKLFTDADTAWARDEATDRQLTQAIRAGATMVVKGTSSRGTLTTDTYSLSGSSDAYRAISEACELAS